MRRMVMSLQPEDLPSECVADRSVLAVVADLPFVVVTASVVAVCDGSVSVYMTSGQAIIGAGEHEHIRSQAERLLTMTEAAVEMFDLAQDHGPPAKSEVAIYAVTRQGVRVSKGPMTAVASGNHPLAPLFAQAQEVLTQVRTVSQRP